MNRIFIHDINDPRIEPYRNVRDPIMRRDRGKFMAESKQIVLRMFAAGLRAESVLTDEKRADELAAVVPADVPHYVITEEKMREMAGFAIHTGTLAIGFRPPETSLEQIMEQHPRQSPLPGVFLLCEKLKEPVNTGSMVRVAAAMGAAALVLGPESCDPFYRRAIRVSMGAVFKQPIARSTDLLADVRMLQQKYGVHCVATVLADDAITLPRFHHDGDVALLLGHEVDGLSRELIDAADSRVTLPMARGTDSLNVAVSAAVFAYHVMHMR
ncbi:MAG: TrmH family RNA methyltransferase [Phycisphaerales bacterium]